MDPEREATRCSPGVMKAVTNWLNTVLSSLSAIKGANYSPH